MCPSNALLNKLTDALWYFLTHTNVVNSYRTCWGTGKLGPMCFVTWCFCVYTSKWEKCVKSKEPKDKKSKDIKQCRMTCWLKISGCMRHKLIKKPRPKWGQLLRHHNSNGSQLGVWQSAVSSWQSAVRSKSAVGSRRLAVGVWPDVPEPHCPAWCVYAADPHATPMVHPYRPHCP